MRTMKTNGKTTTAYYINLLLSHHYSWCEVIIWEHVYWLGTVLRYQTYKGLVVVFRMKTIISMENWSKYKNMHNKISQYHLNWQNPPIAEKGLYIKAVYHQIFLKPMKLVMCVCVWHPQVVSRVFQPQTKKKLQSQLFEFVF